MVKLVRQMYSIILHIFNSILHILFSYRFLGESTQRCVHAVSEALAFLPDFSSVDGLSFVQIFDYYTLVL